MAFQRPAQPPTGPQAGQHLGPQPQDNGMQWQRLQQSSTQQIQPQHSFAASMDLISSTSSNGPRTQSGSHQFQSDLFRSSSHHTSHTVAAGDLLTMSRRSLDQPDFDQNNASPKKRSATMADSTGNPNQFNFMGRSNSSGGQNHMNASANPQQHGNAPQHVRMVGGLFANAPAGSQQNGQGMSGAESATYVSSSTVGTMEDNGESYREHRTIRRCRRSDSFEMEMMEDD